MKYCVISSSSKGNCTLINYNNTSILIDFGCAKKRVVDGLALYGLGLDDVDKLLITHSHSDHTKNIKYIPKEKYLASQNVLNEELEDNQYLFFYNEIKIGDLLITPFPLSHDAINTTGFLIKDPSGESLVYITDTGYIKDKVLDLIKGCTYYIFESNHDTKMLYESKRDSYLISRIHSDKGHLDNVASASYLADLITDNTKEITLAHLSEECNTPEICLKTLEKVFIDKLGGIPNIRIRCASDTEFTKGGKY